MKRPTARCVCILGVLALLLGASVAEARDFDAETISQLSKSIAEGVLLNANKTAPRVEQQVYVSGSLGETARKRGSSVGIVHGLAAFDDGYGIQSEIRQWELNRSADLSGRYMSRLPTNPTVDVAGDLTIKGVSLTYQEYMRSQFNVVNALRGYQNRPPLTAYPTSWQAASATYTVASTGLNAGITFVQTIDRIGTSMQVMNPPIYLHEKTSYGCRGEGFYDTPSARVHYQETLTTAGPGPITRTHTDWVTTNTGTYVRRVQTVTPASNSFERFMMRHYPVGSYWDPQSTETYTVTWSQQSYRVENMGGVGRGTSWSCPGSTTGSWQSPLPTFDATWKTATIGNSTYSYPSIDWSSGLRNSSIDWSRMNGGAGATQWRTGAGVNLSNITSARIGPPVSNTVRYLAPDVLFSMKDPLTAYTSQLLRSTMSSYSSCPVLGIPTYKLLPTPPVPPSGRRW